MLDYVVERGRLMCRTRLCGLRWAPSGGASRQSSRDVRSRRRRSDLLVSSSLLDPNQPSIDPIHAYPAASSRADESCASPFASNRAPQPQAHNPKTADTANTVKKASAGLISLDCQIARANDRVDIWTEKRSVTELSLAIQRQRRPAATTASPRTSRLVIVMVMRTQMRWAVFHYPATVTAAEQALQGISSGAKPIRRAWMLRFLRLPLLR